jgi:RNA polymerase sigma-70 factor (ECF subfamily)
MKAVMVRADERTSQASGAQSRGLGFEEFYAAEYPKIVRLAYALTGQRAVAEEEAQESLMAAHRNWAKVARYNDPAAWLRRVVTNRCTSVARRRLTDARLMVRLRSARAAQPELPVTDEALWSAVRSLPRRQRQVVALRFVEDRSIDDIASILDCDQPTVRTHLRRGRLAVAAALKIAEEDQ